VQTGVVPNFEVLKKKCTYNTFAESASGGRWRAWYPAAFARWFLASRGVRVLPLVALFFPFCLLLVCLPSAALLDLRGMVRLNEERVTGSSVTTGVLWAASRRVPSRPASQNVVVVAPV